MRGTVYLWGGAEISEALPGKTILALKVDDFGEEITIGTRKTSNVLTQLGKLRPGQAFTISVEGLLGIWARTSDPLDSNVECMLLVN